MKSALLVALILAQGAGCQSHSSNAAAPAESSSTSHVDNAAVQTHAQSRGQVFLAAKLAELDAFKFDPRFRQYGFGAGGPFKEWLNAVQSKRNAQEFTLMERVAVGDLLNLGMEYLKTNGRENEFSRFAREQIDASIRGE